MRGFRPILLVGSVPLSDAEAVFTMTAAKLGEHAKRYPDGETGRRTNWIRWQRDVFDSHPDFELENPDPTIAGIKDAQARPIYKLRTGKKDLVIGTLGYAKEAIASYATFTRLKRAGVIPPGTRFQVSLPTAMAVISSFVALADRAAAEPAFEKALEEEIKLIAKEIPPHELAIQWDAVFELVGYDGGYPLHYSDLLEGGIARIARHVDFVPAGIEVGIHLCYGDPGHKHIIEPKSLLTSVEFSNGIVAAATREVNWIHMPVPHDRTDRNYYEPLRGLHLGPETQVYLGLIHQRGGLPAIRARAEIAQQFIDKFGVAAECGFGRRPAETVPGLFDLHKDSADLSAAQKV